MTITLSETLILNQVDKIILLRSNNYTIKRKKTLAAHEARPALHSTRELLYKRAETQPVIFFLDSQLGLILMRSTSKSIPRWICNARFLDLLTNRCKMITS